MDRRFALFLGLAFAILALNQVVAYLFRPPAPANQVAKLGADEKADLKKKDAKKPGDKDAAAKGKEGEPKAPAGDEAAPLAAEEPADPEKAANENGAKPAAAVAKAFPAKTVALGSLNNSSPYRMLVTLTSSGAAVERVELNSPRYQELEDPAIRPVAGYLGHLSPTDGKPGARVEVVGAGTPAAAAGIQIGDIVTDVGGQVVSDAVGLQSALNKTSPGDSVVISIRRAGKPLTLTAALTREPLQLIAPEFDSKPLDVVAGAPHDQLSLLLALQQVDGVKIDERDPDFKAMRETNWEVIDQGQVDEVAFRWDLPRLGLEIVKRFSLAKVEADNNAPGYNVNLKIEIRNTGSEAKSVAYQLDGPTGLPIEGAWYASKISHNWTGSGLRDVVLRYEGKDADEIGCLKIADDTAKATAADNQALAFVAVDAVYFAAAVIPQYVALGDLWFNDVIPLRVGAVPEDKNNSKLTDITFRLVSRPQELQPDDTLEHSFIVFAGPKQPDVLEQYAAGNGNLGDLVYYGLFGWVARPMLAILHTFHALVGNYGIAILLLTVLVRGCMFPLSRKQAVSAQMMQQLQPQIKALNEKYKKDPAARTKAQQELFRKHNYNPLGGCLLMFVQLPIFLGLYRSLMVDVELRQAPLFGEAIRWCSNLAAPDMFWDWSPIMPHLVSFGTGFFGLGPYLNLLPLVTIALFIWQQKMFMPPPADEQAALQQKMMQYMMIFMGIMFYKVASGLCLYFIASSLWGIAERKLLPKTIGAPGGPGTAPAEVPRSNPPSSSPGGNGSPGGKKKQRNRK